MARKSSIAKLPDSIRGALQAYLRDESLTQAEITERINLLLEDLGVDYRISTSAINRYAQQMQVVGEKLRQSREVSQMWIAKLGTQPAGQVGVLINEMIRTLIFELMVKLQDKEIEIEDAPELAKMIKNLANGVERLERAASENEKREAEIRKQAAAEAAETAAKSATKAGLSTDAVAQIKREILGIAA